MNHRGLNLAGTRLRHDKTNTSEKECFMFRPSTVMFLLAISLSWASAQTPAARLTRPTPPTRDSHTPGYVMAKELPDGENAPATVDGNFILGPTHKPAPESTVHEGVPQGTVYNFTMESADSKFYPGIARDPRIPAADTIDPAKRVVNSHPAPYTRR